MEGWSLLKKIVIGILLYGGIYLVQACSHTEVVEFTFANMTDEDEEDEENEVMEHVESLVEGMLNVIQMEAYFCTYCSYIYEPTSHRLSCSKK